MEKTSIWVDVSPIKKMATFQGSPEDSGLLATLIRLNGEISKRILSDVSNLVRTNAPKFIFSVF